jgi:hypothetical protein
LLHLNIEDIVALKIQPDLTKEGQFNLPNAMVQTQPGPHFSVQISNDAVELFVICEAT